VGGVGGGVGGGGGGQSLNNDSTYNAAYTDRRQEHSQLPKQS